MAASSSRHSGSSGASAMARQARSTSPSMCFSTSSRTPVSISSRRRWSAPRSWAGTSSRMCALRWMARAISSVILCCSKSRPLGLPVTSESPKASSRSSRSWNASPSAAPYSSKAGAASARPATAAPRTSGRWMV
ncbi:hypothetical protein Z951_09290 [Streptomyces sp. PRh5]|nr:hypothetical protein Z951_09290 [Streptomyces sp. PRh5]